MKDGVIIINTARGPIIDYKALTDAIRNGKVGGAALDVYEPEPPDPSNELFKLERTVLTPHIAWNTEETEKYILDVTLNTIKEFLAGLRPKNIIV
jgi:phosphoglycerate dehydrogenase-like enzyme